MFALILVTGFHAFAGGAGAFVLGAVAGYAFRGKIHGGITAAGAEVGKVAGDVAKKA